MILRTEIVERAKAGDKVIFTGTFIVVPDVAALGLPGVNAEMMRENQGGRSGPGSMGNLGVSGLKSLGVKDLTYKTAFLACMATSADTRVSEIERSALNGSLIPDRLARPPSPPPRISGRTIKALKRTEKNSSRA